MNAKRLIVLALVIGAAAVGGYFYWFAKPGPLVLTGIVTTNDVVVSPQIGGKLDRLLVTEGDTVKRDQLIAVIAPQELQAESSYATQSAEGVTSQVKEAQAALRYQQLQTQEQIHQAEATLASTEAQQAAAVADLENAKLTFDRNQNLASDGVTSPSQLDESRTAFQAAQARVDALKRQADAQRATVALAHSNAEQNSVRASQLQANQHMQAAAAAQQAKADVRLAYTDVTAPIDGIVDVRAARAGEVVNAGQPIVTLVNPDDLWVRADVEESYIDRIKLGDHLKVRLPSGAELDGVVFYRGVDADYATQRDVSRTKRDIRTFEIRLRCDNKDRRLAVGMTAYVLLPVPQ
jgi:HlyD family secretion protein